MYLFNDEIEETKWSRDEYISFFKKRVSGGIRHSSAESVSSAGFGAGYMGLIPTQWFTSVSSSSIVVWHRRRRGSLLTLLVGKRLWISQTVTLFL
jgi:hypothetical protein